MRQPSVCRARPARIACGLLLAGVAGMPGCASQGQPADDRVRAAVNEYLAVHRNSSAAPAETENRTKSGEFLRPADGGREDAEPLHLPSFTLGSMQATRPTTQSQRDSLAEPRVRSRSDFEIDEPAMKYWHRDVWRQMGVEARDFATDGLWRGFKVSYANLPNAVVLGLTMGASVTFRESGVDRSISDKTNHNQELRGGWDDTIQIIGNPATHFAGAGLLWLGTTLTKDMRDHEVAKALFEALIVNGVSIEALKLGTNTSSPDNDRYAWPSGHTSSSFAVAAVLNEYYGPWVGIPSLAMAGLVGYQRIDSRVHDFSDVVFGGVMGYVIGASIARHDKEQMPELFGMKILPFADSQNGGAGIALWKQW